MIYLFFFFFFLMEIYLGWVAWSILSKFILAIFLDESASYLLNQEEAALSGRKKVNQTTENLQLQLKNRARDMHYQYDTSGSGQGQSARQRERVLGAFIWQLQVWGELIQQDGKIDFLPCA